MATVINVCGTGYCGSTMVDLMLGNAPDAFSCGEVHAWFRPWRAHHFSIDCSCGKDPCPIWERIKKAPESQFHATVVKELGVDFVIDSSKSLIWLIDVQKWAVASGMDSMNLLVWKEPISLAYSHWKRGRGLVSWRKDFVKYHERLFKIGLPFMAVNYNDLVRDPSRKLAQICTAIGMPYFEGKERFWEKQHHYLFGSGGVRRQVKAGNSTIKPRESFPPEFDQHVAALQRRIAMDTDLQQTMQRLRQADVSAASDRHNKPVGNLESWSYPWWYYLKKVRQSVKHYLLLLGLNRRSIPRSSGDR